MEDLVGFDLFGGIYRDKTVLVTGHTGFKGSWLCLWLEKMGAKVVGYSLEAPTQPNHFELLRPKITSIIGDIRDSEKLDTVFQKYRPEIVFHLAAQALVRPSYEDPVATYETNVLGTLKVFEAARKAYVKAIVNITSDKAYENNECNHGYQEGDPLGGYDPYSSSKGCAELLTASYRNSYFHPKEYKKTHNTLLASCRAGNVIGGGDWARDRLITDIMVSVSQHKKVHIRNPYAIRPWQHVLEPLSGYMLLGQKLLEKRTEFASAWNFGPTQESVVTVEDVVKKVKQYWDKIEYVIDQKADQPHEAQLLNLDCTKANRMLQWESVWSSEKTFEKTVEWYKTYYEKSGTLDTIKDLQSYVSDAKVKGSAWTKC